MVKVLTTMTELRYRCLCDDDGLMRLEEGSEAMDRIRAGTLTSERVSKGHRRKILRDLPKCATNAEN